MFKAIGWLFKTAFFAAVILVLGNWIEWDQRTLSEHAGQAVARAKGIWGQLDPASGWANKLESQAKTRAQKVSEQLNAVIRDSKHDSASSRKRSEVRTKTSTVSTRKETHQEEHPGESERQKLRSLIEELNREPSQDVGLKKGN